MESQQQALAAPGAVRPHPLRWTGLTARQATAAIGAALVVLLCLTTLAGSWILRQRALEDWRADMSSLSLVLSENVAQTMASTYLVLDSIVDAVELAQAAHRHAGPVPPGIVRNEAIFQMMRDKISALPQVDVATVTAADGTVLTFTRSYPAPTINLADRDYFIYHRDHTDPGAFLSAPVRNKGNGKWTFYVSRRLNAPDGTFAGVVLVGVSCDFFSAFFRNVSLGEHAAITLYRRDHTVLARWPQAEKLMGQRVLSGTTYQVLAAGKDHDVVTTRSPRQSSDGAPVSRMGAVRVVRNYPLVINATITEELLLDGWWRNVRLLGGIVAVAVLLLAVVFWLMALLLKRRERDAEEARQLMLRADSASEAKSRFLAMMSHEIRTPMNGIVGMSELMLGTPLDNVQRSYARNVHSGVLELMQIINEVLDFSKVESGRMELEVAAFDPREHLLHVIELHQASARQKGLQITATIDIGPGRMRADPARLRQVLGNLISNAVKFTPVGGIRVRLRSSIEAGKWRLYYEVQDSGIGIDAQTQQLLFEPFSQADNTISRQYGGTGLGLAICKRLVQLMGGEISVDSSAGAGATFRFDVPCEPASAADETARSAAAVLPPAPAMPPPVQEPAEAAGKAMPAPAGAAAAAPAAEAGVPLRVLLAEDTEMNRQLARILLGRLGCVVDDAHNGQLALDALAANRYDLVLMDCMMPVMDGYEATRRLRALEQSEGRPRVPVIALTASAIEGDRQRCLDAGMDDYLAKPFTGAQFTAMVARWRSRPAP